MCTLNISVKNNYITVDVKNKNIKCLTSPVLSKYVEIKSFDKENGVVSLIAELRLCTGETVNDEDWIDLNDTLGFAFKNPQEIIKEIDSVQLK